MFAVVKTGGKQYRVAAGDLLHVEKLDVAAGDTVQLDQVLMVGGESPLFGTPCVDGASVEAEVLDQVKGEKVVSFVKRRRKHGSKRTRGHRQRLTVLRITGIAAPGRETVRAETSAKDAAAGTAPAAGDAAAPAADPAPAAAPATTEASE